MVLYRCSCPSLWGLHRFVDCLKEAKRGLSAPPAARRRSFPFREGLECFNLPSWAAANSPTAMLSGSWREHTFLDEAEKPTRGLIVGGDLPVTISARTAEVAWVRNEWVTQNSPLGQPRCSGSCHCYQSGVASSATAVEGAQVRGSLIYSLVPSTDS
jgi:hypothetical protein